MDKYITDENGQGVTIDIPKELKETQEMLNTLLCFVHRDGGHYIAQHGLKKATDDAIKIVCDWRPDTYT